jgi:hypothetical protein
MLDEGGDEQEEAIEGWAIAVSMQFRLPNHSVTNRQEKEKIETFSKESSNLRV